MMRSIAILTVMALAVSLSIADVPGTRDGHSILTPPAQRPAGTSVDVPSRSPIEGMNNSAFATETQLQDLNKHPVSNANPLTFVANYTGNYIWAGDFGDDPSKPYVVVGPNVFGGVFDELGKMDTSTGVITFIGNCAPTQNPGLEIFTGMAWDATSGTMYLSSTDIVTSWLYTLNLATGGVTLVGSMGADSPGNIALAIDCDGNAFGYDIVNDSMQSIDLSTGTATTIGALGFDANFGQGMDFDPLTGDLYLAAFNNLTFTPEWRLGDTSTGNTVVVSTIGTGILQHGWVAITGDCDGGGGLPQEVCDALSNAPFRSKCQPNGTINFRIRMIGFIGFGGTNVTFTVDGTDEYTFAIEDAPNGVGSQISGQFVGGYAPGDHKVEVVDCGLSWTVNCQSPDALDLTLENDLVGLPVATELRGNYPNPFNPSTTISYALAADSYVTLKVYNTLGQEVATLVDGFQTAGYLTATWNGRNDFGSTVSSGIYIYRLTAGDVVQSAKMMFTK
jgi:hypothetical protein